jgi:CBS-domain-containing membrane protein
MSLIRDLPLAAASVSDAATFGDASRALSASKLAAIAVVDAEQRVVGVFTQDAQLRGLFPGYLAELRHTAFLDDDAEGLAERARTVGADPVTRYATKAPSLDAGESHTHAAELFLHHGIAALPVVDGGRFLGMLGQGALCDAADDLLERDQS